VKFLAPAGIVCVLLLERFQLLLLPTLCRGGVERLTTFAVRPGGEVEKLWQNRPIEPAAGHFSLMEVQKFCGLKVDDVESGRYNGNAYHNGELIHSGYAPVGLLEDCVEDGEGTEGGECCEAAQHIS
jgi:hypothetical protein